MRLPASKRCLLGATGRPNDISWGRGFAALTKFKAREGHCRVPKFHIEGKYRLGQWVIVQRAKMPPERRMRLNKIGFVWSAR